MTRYNRELALALAAFAACLAWSFQRVLLTGEVYSVGVNLPAEKAVLGLYEMSHQIAPLLYTTVRAIKAGVFPAWTTAAQAGTPLLGKMGIGFFAPHQIPLYLLPAEQLPYWITATLALKALLAFLGAYFYARVMRLPVWSAALVGILYNYTRLFSDGLYAFWSTAAYFPVLLALIELYFRKQRKLVLFLLPWMFAFPFLAVHVETAFRLSLMAGFYFLFHLYRTQDIPGEEKWRHLAFFSAAGMLGALIASPQLAAGTEYAANSYNSVWRNLPEYGWLYRTIHKHIASGDLPALLLGAAGIGGAVRLAGLKSGAEPWSKNALVRSAAGAAAFALGTAALASIGMDDSLEKMAAFDRPVYPAASWLTGIAMLFLAFWGWSQAPCAGLRALGWLLIVSILTMLKAPPVSTLLSHLPFFRLFNNTLYLLEFDLCRAVLFAAGLNACAAPAKEAWKERARAAARAARAAAVFALGYAGAQGLEGWAARALPSSLMPGPRLERSPEGGFTSPERITTYARSRTLSGWLQSFPPATSVVVGRREGQTLEGAKQAVLTAAGARQKFSAEISLPESGEAQVFAQAAFPNGSRKVFPGPLIQTLKRPPLWLLVAAAIASPLLLLLPVKAHAFLYLWVAVLCAATRSVPTIPAEQFPLKIDGLNLLRKDHSRFRVSAFRYDLLSADYANIYGFEELRTGGDNLDILPMLYFQRLALALLADPAKPGAVESGLRLLGLANVKYLLDLPAAEHTHPGLRLLHAGRELSIYENLRHEPRVRFFAQARHVPVGDFRDWRNNGNVFGPMMRAVSEPGFDPRAVLLLNDPPRPADGPALAPPEGPAPRAQLLRYEDSEAEIEVDAPGPGYILLADNAFPGWSARVNGVKSPILRAWLTFRAVAVPAGKSKIVFRYRSARLALAVWLACLAAAGWGFSYIGYRLRRPPLETPEEPPRKEKSRKKEKAVVPEDARARIETAVHAYSLERFALCLIVPTLLYWTLWAGFSFRGGLVRNLPGLSDGWWVNAAACLLFCAWAAHAWRVWSGARTS